MTTHHHPVQFEERDGEIVVNVPNVRIKLIRNTKGVYWEISTAAETADEALAATGKIDAALRKHYGTTE
jgi:hypothetical protein